MSDQRARGLVISGGDQSLEWWAVGAVYAVGGLLLVGAIIGLCLWLAHRQNARR